MTTRYQCNECDWTGDDPLEEEKPYWDDAYGARQKFYERVLRCPECQGEQLEKMECVK